MPELPEVETVVRTLEGKIRDRRIEKIEVRYPSIIDGDPAVFCAELTRQRFRRFCRRGKYLLFYMDDVLLVCHLRMEGKFFLQKPGEEITRHTHVIFTLDNGYELRYLDTRKFGRMYVCSLDTDIGIRHKLGPEPFAEEFNAVYILSCSKSKDMPIKALLLDQRFVAGIGNIYADEILFACGIRPSRSCRRLTGKDAENLAVQTRLILRKAIKAGGTTIRSYASSQGVTGRFQLQCNVHARKECRKCSHEVKIKRISGRSSYYCPVCQKK